VAAGSVESESARAHLVSENYFALLGDALVQGRPFLPGERVVAILSHNYWQQRFGGKPGVVWQTVILDRERFHHRRSGGEGVRWSFPGRT
jgi:hypothetical protein